MTEAIANTLSHVATNYASRHDSIEHQWMTVAGFLTGRVGNYKDRVTYNRHVVDVQVQAEQIRDDRSNAGIVYHSRNRQAWVPGVHAPIAQQMRGDHAVMPMASLLLPLCQLLRHLLITM